MMIPTEEQRDERLDNASQLVRHLYTSVESGQKLKEVFDRNRLNQDDYKEYALAVGDVVLGFFSPGKLPELLQERIGVSKEKAIATADDLRDFFADLPEPEDRTVARQEPAIESETSTDTAEQAPTTSEQEPAIPPVRTMEGDAERIHGYGAYRPRRNAQEENAQPNKSQLADLPRYGEDEK